MFSNEKWMISELYNLGGNRIGKIKSYLTQQAFETFFSTLANGGSSTKNTRQ